MRSVHLVEVKSLKKATTGVKDATVNFMTLKMNVEFEEGAPSKFSTIAKKG